MPTSRSAMTESLDTHQALAVCQAPSSRQALSALGIDAHPGCHAAFAGRTLPHVQVSSFAVYTHKLHAPCLVAADLGLLQPATSVYTYKQTRFCLRVAARRQQAHAKRLSVTVYTHKRLTCKPTQQAALCSPGMAHSMPAVYTYKQALDRQSSNPRSAPPPGQRRPPYRVYTHKHPHPNPAQSGVRCVWALKTGDQP